MLFRKSRMTSHSSHPSPGSSPENGVFQFSYIINVDKTLEDATPTDTTYIAGSLYHGIFLRHSTSVTSIAYLIHIETNKSTDRWTRWVVRVEQTLSALNTPRHALRPSTTDKNQAPALFPLRVHKDAEVYVVSCRAICPACVAALHSGPRSLGFEIRFEIRVRELAYWLILSIKGISQ